MRYLPYSLQGRFLAGLVLIMIIVGAFFAFALRSYMNDLLLAETRAKATLMVSHTEAIQAYVRSVLRPAVSKIIEPDAFILEAMSTSFVTRHILDELRLENPDFLYRRVAKNARNPASELNTEEVPFFGAFLNDPTKQRMERIIRAEGQERLVTARPVRFTPDCMHCHGDPNEAPAVLLSMYGEERGFYRQTGELAGLDIISVPLEAATGVAGQSVIMFALWFGAGMLILLLALQGFFNRLVVHNLRRVGGILHRSFFQDEDQEVVAPLGREEEIEGMVRSIEAVVTHLSDARAQLRDYAKNLESMVRTRTAALETVAKERSADVRLFVHLLSALNRKREKRDLLRASVGLIARRFNAGLAMYMCGLSGTDFMVWPSNKQAELMADQSLRTRAARYLRDGKPVLLPEAWHIPVQTSGQTRGLLSLFWHSSLASPSSATSESLLDESLQVARPDKEQAPLAIAFGRQLGIALDNLDVLDALLRQNSLLDSLVEGIAEPLVLMEQWSIPVLANSSARALARRLSHSLSLVPVSEERNALRPAAGVAGNLKELTTMLGRMGIPAGQALPEAVEQREVTLADGSSFVLSLRPLWSASSGRARAVIHLRETTEEKRMLLHLRQSEKLAAVGQLAAGLAHEINNPLGVIHCYAELLSAGAQSEQGKADLAIILRHVEQAQSVLRDLLDFARPHAACPGPCDVSAMLLSLREVFRPKLRLINAKMCLDVESGLPELYLDSGMLEQVLVNLLLNAIDAVGEAGDIPGVINVTAFRDGDSGHLAVLVADNGAGIDAAHLPKLFDPFFTTKEPGTGTGLGLAVAFALVRDMGGRLEVRNHDSGQGRGAAFLVLLPVDGEERAMTGQGNMLGSRPRNGLGRADGGGQ